MCDWPFPIALSFCLGWCWGKTLSSALCVGTSLTRLVLTCHHLKGERAWVHLFKGLEESASLQDLRIGSHGCAFNITHEGAKSLSTALVSTSSMTRLHLCSVSLKNAV